jgi:PRC-barrel domain
MAEGQQDRTEGARPQTPQQQQAARQADSGPQVTGAVPGSTSLTVSQISRHLYNAQGNELGDVERVVEGSDGKQYIVIGAGGFLGIGEKHVPIPLERVVARGDRLVTQGLTEDQIRSMQTVDRNDRRFRELDGNQQVQINAIR